MENELISEGLTLMLAGMGTVFVFLTALVVVMTVMSRLVLSFASDETAAAGDEEIAAISAAIKKHRSQ